MCYEQCTKTTAGGALHTRMPPATKGDFHMERWGAILLSVFAVYRIALMLANEEGPFSLAEEFRRGVRRRTQGKRAEWIARGVECPRCMSFWLSAVAALIMVQRGYVPYQDVLVAWFGLAGVVFLMLVLIPFEVKIILPEDVQAPPGENGRGVHEVVVRPFGRQRDTTGPRHERVGSRSN